HACGGRLTECVWNLTCGKEYCEGLSILNRGSSGM
nr:major glycoprotein PSP-I - pig (fragments) [Sus scrofa domesticus]